MKAQAKRNSEIAASRKHVIILIALVLFALLSSSCFAKGTSHKPAFSAQQAFVLNSEDRKLYHANYAWCFPTPTADYQCQVIGSAMSGALGYGQKDINANIKEYGDVGYTPISVMDLPADVRKDIQDIYDFTWSM